MAGTRVSFNTVSNSLDNQSRVKPDCRVLNGKRFAASTRAAHSRSLTTLQRVARVGNASGRHARCRSCWQCFGATTLGQGLTMLPGRASRLVNSG